MRQLVQYTFLPSLPPSLARAPARPRIAGEMDGLAEVGDAAHAAYERTRTDPVDAIVLGKFTYVLRNHFDICGSFYVI